MGIYSYTRNNSRKDALMNTMNIVNMINYILYICNNFFLHFSYTPYPKLSLTTMITMANHMASWKPFHPKRFIMLINYASLYALCTACTAKRLLDTLSFQKLSFPIDFFCSYSIL